MEVFDSRKGITPVIAIVLLLMVTVGAVGVVYTQFNSLVGNPQEQLDEQQRNQDTRIRISELETNATSISDTNTPAWNETQASMANHGTIMMTIQNSGSVSRNTTSFVLTAITGEEVGQWSDRNVTCFTAENSTILDPQGSYTCNTGIQYPKVTQEVQLEVLLSGSAKTWTDTCHVTTSGAEIC